jgi:hypothetical protein
MNDTTDFLGGQSCTDAQVRDAVEEQATPAAKVHAPPTAATSQGSKIGRGRAVNDAHLKPAPAQGILDGQMWDDAHADHAVDEQAAPPTRVVPTPKVETSAGRITTELPSGQIGSDAHRRGAAGAQARPAGAMQLAQPTDQPLRLVDPLLALLAENLDDLEKVRIATENRLRHLTRNVDDSDGERRGLGLSEADAPVAAVAAVVESLNGLEKDATRQLQKALRKHPLGPWIKAQKGVGDKQCARLLAAIGDPYWNDLHGRPRTVSELWAYTGLHVLPVGQRSSDTHSGVADGDPNFRTGQNAVADHIVHAGPELNHPSGQSSRAPQDAPAAGAPGTRPGPTSAETQSASAGAGQAGSDPGHESSVDQRSAAGVAPSRARGQRANWSATAKMRAFLIAEACIKQLGGACKELGENRHLPDGDCTCGRYRTVYDYGRIKYAASVHPADCKRCGPAGKPALAGTPLSPGHQHARAMRLVMKELLKDLWIQARAIHEGEGGTP